MRIAASGKARITAGILTILALAGAAILLWPSPKPKVPVTIVRPANVVRYSTPTPSEKPATEQTYHSTAKGNEPSYIKLPTIQAEGYIQAVGLDQDGAVAAPNNVNLAGWYVDGLIPGQEGLSIIDGHVDGKTAPGIFYQLSKLTAGDTFEVDLASKQVLHFTVKSVSQVAAKDAAAKLFARDYSIVSQLNLITCGGRFDQTAGAYNDRIIVVAALAG